MGRDARRFLAFTLAAVLAIQGSPALALHDLVLTSNVPRVLYFANDGALYSLDLSSYHDDALAYAQGNGTLVLRMQRLLYHDSPAEKRFALEAGRPPGPYFRLLGSDPTVVASAMGVDPREALGEAEVLALTLGRSAGVATTSVVVGDDRIEFEFPEEFFEGPPGGSLREGRYTINGTSTSIDKKDFDELWSMAAGSKAYDPDLVPGVSALADRLDDAEAVADALTGFAAVTADLRRLQPLPATNSCAPACTACAIASGSLAIGFVGLMACGSLTLGGCLILGVGGYALSIGGAGMACAACFDCLGGGGGGGGGGGDACSPGSTCAAVCPPGQASTGDCVIGGSPGVCCEVFLEDCDPWADPDGCECDNSMLC